jgi:hypothetical protein
VLNEAAASSGRETGCIKRLYPNGLPFALPLPKSRSRLVRTSNNGSGKGGTMNGQSAKRPQLMACLFGGAVAGAMLWTGTGIARDDTPQPPQPVSALGCARATRPSRDRPGSAFMPLQLWPDPRDGLDPTDPFSGLDPNDATWNWVEVDSYHDGPTNNPPNSYPGWERWYFRYEKPDGDRVKVSADRDPQTGEWFNPHLSSSQLWP